MDFFWLSDVTSEHYIIKTISYSHELMILQSQQFASNNIDVLIIGYMVIKYYFIVTEPICDKIHDS